MKHIVSYRNLEGDILKDKAFNTKQEQLEDYEDRKVTGKILISDEWFKIRYKRKEGSEFIVGVSKWNG